MRITIEPSAGAELWDIPQHKVVIDYPTDEVTLPEVIEMITCAIRGYGFNVRDLQEAEDETTND